MLLGEMFLDSPLPSCLGGGDFVTYNLEEAAIISLQLQIVLVYLGSKGDCCYNARCLVTNFIQWCLVLAPFLFPHSLVRFPTVELFMFTGALY